MHPLTGGALPPGSHGPGFQSESVGQEVNMVELFVGGDTYIGHLEYSDNSWKAYWWNGSTEIAVGAYETQAEAFTAVTQAQE